MFVKRAFLLLMAAVLMLCVIPAMADTYYVYTENGKTLNLRSPVDNSVIGHIPYGTALEPDPSLSTETAAYVTYKGTSGYVKWSFLVKNPPKPKNGSNAQPPVQNQSAGEGSITIQAVGCTISYASGGGSYSEVSYDTPVKLKIAAPKKPAYWVINGVRYDFEPNIPSSFTLDNALESMTIEAVMKKETSSTLLSADQIQQIRTDEQLIVETIHAELCHLNAKHSGGGGWITSFDFTEDYINRATKKTEEGGQVTIRVQAKIPKGKKISYWLFNEAKIDFNTNVTKFVVCTLNTSMTYEPVFGSGSKATEAPSAVNTRPQPRATAEPTQTPSAVNTRPQPSGTLEPTQAPSAVNTRPQAKIYYNVTCTNCTFSGGGVSNASSARVEAGTTITVTTSSSGTVVGWYVNGAHKMKTRQEAFLGSSFTLTVNKDTTIVCQKTR